MVGKGLAPFRRGLVGHEAHAGTGQADEIHEAKVVAGAEGEEVGGDLRCEIRDLSGIDSEEEVQPEGGIVEIALAGAALESAIGVDFV